MEVNRYVSCTGTGFSDGDEPPDKADGVLTQVLRRMLWAINH